ncbi:DUF2935 domain-containing protein [Alicyclobacillus dauci]|uniref:DUF2935 domain-containing protein n=1 Tax=Alicyclobacillus dauci TaxID=1475485 RepID=A0ABY6Z5I6_9BACL|nr:DUF2935 domain-containing protein [Alicyclobacillus dauci]WAH38072.1 DUF2935 domain-containing protein [Alicyclobacillus dauci]
MTKDYQQTAIFEHRFWLQILGDHARFIRAGLSPTEGGEIAKTNYFIDRFDRLLSMANTIPSTADIVTLNQYALRYAHTLRAFKLHLLRRHLIGKISIALPPTFLNHMLNEIEEYLRILESLCEGTTPPPLNPIHHHLLWLHDAIGHAATIQAEVDPVETRAAERSLQFTKEFEAFYLKSVELAGYLRTQLEDFPALRHFNSQVGMEMKLFTEFLDEIEELRLSKELLGTLEPLLPDHMAREECYYLLKLADVTDVTAHLCDPAKPRVEG